MDNQKNATGSEYTQVVADAAAEFYAQHAPDSLAQRLSHLHSLAWEALMSGQPPAVALGELRRQAGRLFGGEALVDGCNRAIVWAVTPVIAASLACSGTDERVSLREIEGALMRLLSGALSQQQQQAARAA